MLICATLYTIVKFFRIMYRWSKAPHCDQGPCLASFQLLHYLSKKTYWWTKVRGWFHRFGWPLDVGQPELRSFTVYCQRGREVTGRSLGALVWQEDTKRCRLSWLTNSALVYEPKYGGRGGISGSQPKSTAVHRSPNKLWRSNSIFNPWRVTVQLGVC